MVPLIWRDCDGLWAPMGAEGWNKALWGLWPEGWTGWSQGKAGAACSSWRIEGAVKHWEALSVPKGSLRWVCYFNPLRAVLKDNLFLIPPASWSKWFSFLFPFSPGWGHRRDSEREWLETGAPQPDPLSIIPGCFLPAAPHSPFELIPNQCQRNECTRVSSVLWWGLGCPFL